MAKNKITTQDDVTVLADMKKRAKREVYGEITIDIPYSLFSEFIDGINDQLEYHDLDNIDHFDLAIRADVRQEFERQVNESQYDNLRNYGGDFDFDFVEDMFESEIAKYEAEEEAREAKEEAELLAQAKEREAEELRRRATLVTIEVSNENRQKAIAVLKAAGLIN